MKNLRSQFQPFADKLADELAQLTTTHLDGLLERARAYAINKLRAELEGTKDAEAETEVGHRDRDGSRAALPQRNGRRGVRVRDGSPRAGTGGADRAGAEKGARQPTCSKCKQAGHNARSCGRQPKGNPHGPKSSTTDLVAKPPPPTSLIDRFAAIEAAARARRGE